MDNLELLKQLPDNYIDLIYCDILYGTGRNFGGYKDLKCDRKVIEEHYIPRITEMHRVLKNTGSIYLQMDTRINHWVRCIMDDIFGYEHFINEIVWCYTVLKKEGKSFPKKHDIILYYSKTDNYTFNTQYIPYKKSNKNNGIKTNNWEEKYREFDNRGKAIEDYWIDLSMLNSMSRERTGYQTQKPKILLKRIIKASSDEGDLVTDFYMGSGTSMVVAKELDRNYIGCDISQKAVDITNGRLARQEAEPKV